MKAVIRSGRAAHTLTPFVHLKAAPFLIKTLDAGFGCALCPDCFLRIPGSVSAFCIIGWLRVLFDYTLLVVPPKIDQGSFQNSTLSALITCYNSRFHTFAILEVKIICLNLVLHHFMHSFVAVGWSVSCCQSIFEKVARRAV